MKSKRGVLRTIGVTVLIAGMVTLGNRWLALCGASHTQSSLSFPTQVSVPVWTQQSTVRVYDHSGNLQSSTHIQANRESKQIAASYDSGLLRLYDGNGKETLTLPVRLEESVTVSSEFGGLPSKETGAMVLFPIRWDLTCGPHGLENYIDNANPPKVQANKKAGGMIVRITPEFTSPVLGLTLPVVRDAQGKYVVRELSH